MKLISLIALLIIVTYSTGCSKESKTNISSTALTTNDANAPSQKTLQTEKSAPEIADAKLRVFNADGDLPFISPVFRINGSTVELAYGADYRNMIIHFAEPRDVVVRDIPCELGKFETGNNLVEIHLDKKDHDMFFDSNWVEYPERLRKIESGGPFASLRISCQRGNDYYVKNAKGVHFHPGVKGIQLEINGTAYTTDEGGDVNISLKGIQNRIILLKFMDQVNKDPIELKISLPIVAARQGLVEYWIMLNVAPMNE